MNEEKVKIGEIKLSQNFYTVEYRLLSKPYTGQVTIEFDRWSDEELMIAIRDDLENKREALQLLDEIAKKWSGEIIDVETRETDSKMVR